MSVPMSRRALAAAVVALVLPLSACGSGGDDGGTTDASGKVEGDITFQTWNLRANFKSYFEDLIAGFEHKYPGTHVKWVDQPAEGYADKLGADAAGGTLPDVVNVSPDLVAPLARAGLVLDLDKAAAKYRPEYLDAAWSSHRVPGMNGTYAFPWYLNTGPLFYNKALFTKAGLDPDQPPRTYDELFTDALRMAEKSDGKVATLANVPTIEDFGRYGVPLMNEQGTGFAFNDPKGVELLTKYKALYDAKALDPQALTATGESSGKKFLTGAVAMNPGSALDLGNFKKNAPGLYRNIGITDQITSTGHVNMYVMGVMVNSRTRHTPARGRLRALRHRRAEPDVLRQEGRHLPEHRRLPGRPVLHQGGRHRRDPGADRRREVAEERRQLHARAVQRADEDRTAQRGRQGAPGQGEPPGSPRQRCQGRRPAAPAGLTAMAAPLRIKRQLPFGPWLFAAPGLLVTGAFVLYPFGSTLANSFTDRRTLVPGHFVGLANFRELLHDEMFWTGLRNSVLYILGVVPALVVLPLLLALLVRKNIPGITFFRSVFYTPVVASIVVVGLIWVWLLDERGLVNSLLESVGIGRIGFLSDQWLLLLSAMAVTVWKGLGYYMIIYMAALANVPRELHEAAAVDGAGPVRRFLSVTVPAVRSTMVLVPPRSPRSPPSRCSPRCT
ncbi:hypothetical protein GCM10017687_33830 [Streptomyces echinatus]